MPGVWLSGWPGLMLRVMADVSKYTKSARHAVLDAELRKLTAIAKAYEREYDRLEDENKRFKSRLAEAKALINDLYPAVAGLVIAAQKTGEKEAEKRWNEYCRRMIEFQPNK